VSNGNVTGVVGRLIEDGLVTRTVDRDDRRAATVRLTRKGREAFLKMAAANERWMDTLFGDLSDREIEELMRLLGRVRRSIDAHPV
jgi:DNA-binding MarR family transcriptional regulator